MSRVARAGLMALAAAGALAASARAQADAIEDSARALEAARAAQARFERVRRASLPWGLGGSGGACGEVVGRFCWRSEGSDEDPPLEPENIGVERLGLLIELAGLSERAPSDRWLVGQQVRYRVEGAQTALIAGRRALAGDPPDLAGARGADSLAREHLAAAETLARACRDDGAGDGWCDALSGLALHVAGRTEEAERAFAGRTGVPPAVLDAARPLRDLLDRDARRLLHQAADTAAFERLLWRLADPFWSLPGNDRRSEHLARVVMARIQEDTRNPFGIPWGDDLRELHARFGWEVAWELTHSPPSLLAAPATVVGHQQDDGFGFVPPGAAIAAGPEAGPEAWEPDREPRREGYAPPYLDSLVSAEHQLAAFRRGDSLLFVVAAAHPGAGDVTTGAGPFDWTRHGPSAALALLPWPLAALPAGPAENPVQVVRAAADAEPGGTWRARARAPAGSYLVSVEALGGDGMGARARYGVRRDTLAAGVLDVSDVLLFAPGPGGETDPEALAARMLTSSRVAAGSAVGVAFEVYGLSADGEAVTFDLSVRRSSASFFRRAARWLGLADADEAVRVRWSDAAAPADGRYGRSLEVSIPADAPPGDYALRLLVRAVGRADVVVERELTILDASGG
ncbi:MAG TPA: hypothetical protein VK837_07430 [Longimicrobiales bacterium]|nr:hypothetical protein [Longimicrobiales bacterium]